MSRDLADILRQHYRLGFTRTLLLVDACLLLMAMLDLLRYWLDGFGFRGDLLAGVDWTSDLVRRTGILLVFLSIILPLLLAVLHVTRVSERFLRLTLARRPALVAVAHMAFTVVFAGLLVLMHSLQNISGFEQNGAVYRYAFQSVIDRVLNWRGFEFLVGGVASLTLAGFAWMVKDLLAPTELSPLVQSYAARVMLADLPTVLRPASGPVRPVELASRRAEEFVQEYHRCGAGSAAAAQWLEQEYESCCEAALNTLVRSRASSLGLRLMLGSNRAFEAALCDPPGPKLVLLSPYATPSLGALMEWLASSAGGRLVRLNLPPEYLNRPWAEQQAAILEQIHGALAADGDGPAVFIASEAHYATGRRVPLAAFLACVRSAAGPRELRIVVDGKSALGNGRDSFIDASAAWDAYVFAPHRWLLAPERCGVLITRAPLACALAVPGCWVPGADKSDTQVRVLASLRSALALAGDPGWDFFWSRSEELRTMFRMSIPDRFEIVGDRSRMPEGFVLSGGPNGGSAWRLETVREIRAEVGKRGLKASIVELEPDRPWLRVALPYYFDPREIFRICQFLKTAIKAA